MRYELIAVGGSWGGLRATGTLLEGIPGELEQPIVVALHRAPDSKRGLLESLLRHHTSRTVAEPDDKDPIVARHVYVAPPDYHLLVEHGRFALSVEARVQYARPSIDVLLASAAESFRERCVGVVLTGANADGAAGLARIVQLGGTAIVQDPATAVRTEMPRAALAAVPTAQVAAPESIASLLIEAVRPKVHA